MRRYNKPDQPIEISSLTDWVGEFEGQWGRGSGKGKKQDSYRERAVIHNSKGAPQLMLHHSKVCCETHERASRTALPSTLLNPKPSQQEKNHK
jgi:hypothetical protein